MELYYKSKSTKLFLERGCSVAQAPKTPPMYTRVYKSVDSVRARGAEAPPPLLLHSLIIVLCCTTTFIKNGTNHKTQ